MKEAPEQDAFEGLLEHLPDGVVVVDAYGLVVYANRAAPEILGQSSSALVGEYFGFPVTEGQAEARVTEQLTGSLAGLKGDAIADLVIAYEPIWAIGTGETATPADAQQMCAHVRSHIEATFGAAAAGSVRIQYGGSVKPGNAPELMAQPDVDGRYLTDTWQLLKSLFPVFDPVLLNREMMGALRARPGRDQAFRAIWQQDFPAELGRVQCPVLAMSAPDDVFIDLLPRVGEAHPDIECQVLNSAGVATPELDTDATVALISDFVQRAEDQVIAGPA